MSRTNRWLLQSSRPCSCGHVSRTLFAESIHRNNFPMFCKPKEEAAHDKR